MRTPASFFSGLWLDLQRKLKTEAQSASEAEFIADVLRVAPPGPLLDVGCGNGRIALALAARGFDVTGVDLAVPLLRQARARAQEAGLPVRLLREDMRRLAFRREFAGAYCWWGSFGILDDAGNKALLGGVARALRPGAPFLLDAHIAETFFPNFRERPPPGRLGDLRFSQAWSYDPTTSRASFTYALRRGRKKELRSGSCRIYGYRELVRLLRTTRFEVSAAFGSLDGKPLEIGASRAYVRAVMRR